MFKSWMSEAAAGNATAVMLTTAYQHRPAVELYDLVKDPFEMQNIADRPENKVVIERLRKELDAWMKQQGDEGAATERDAKHHQALFHPPTK